jgi:predicted nucleic acid-binding protein
MNEAVILLDTNVVSELRPKPAQAVLDWFAAQDSTKLFFSVVSEAELRTGGNPSGWEAPRQSNRHHRHHDHGRFHGPRPALRQPSAAR